MLEKMLWKVLRKHKQFKKYLKENLDFERKMKEGRVSIITDIMLIGWIAESSKHTFVNLVEERGNMLAHWKVTIPDGTRNRTRDVVWITDYDEDIKIVLWIE